MEPSFFFQDGCTALMVHAESGNVDVVSKLLDSHAFMDSQDMVQYSTCLWQSKYIPVQRAHTVFLREKGFVNLREIHNADNDSYHSVMSYSFSLKLPLCISYTIGIL